MGISRRNAIIGIGTLAAGAGVIGASGAFTSVTADRSMEVTTAGDASAALGLVSADDDYVDDSGTTISVDFTSLNIGATTVIDPLVTVANNSNNDIDLGLEVTDDDGNSFSQYVDLIIGGTDTDSNNVAADGTYTINSGQSLNFGVEFDVPDSVSASDFDLTVTVTAEAQS